MSTVKGFNTTLGVLKYDAESLDNYNTPLFDSTSTYEVGDYVIEDGKLYRCTTDVTTAGSWSLVSSNFVAAILTDDIKGIKEDVGDLSTNFSALEGNVGILEDNVQTLSSNVGLLSTDVDNLTTSVGKINNSIALTFNTSTSYAIGDYVLYGGSLYRFTATHAAGAWIGTDATQVQLAEETIFVQGGGTNGSAVMRDWGNNPCIASGDRSFAGGVTSIASGDGAFAYGQKTNGISTTAAGSGSLAIGKGVTANGNASQAFGQETVAKAVASTALGNFTISSGLAATVIGQANVEDTEDVSGHGNGAKKHIFIIGNGLNASNRSNALAVDWDGNEEIAGNLTLNKGATNKFTINGDVIKASIPHDTASGSIASFPDGAALPVRDLSVDIEPVQSGSGDPSPDNVRPISGWTEAKVTRTGKNLCGEAFTHGTYSTANGVFYSHEGASTRYVSVGIIPVKGGQTYTISWQNDPSNTAETSAACFYRGIDFVSSVQLNASKQIAVPENADGVGFSLLASTAITSISQISISSPQLELGSTASSYEAYQGQTYTIDLDGTRYGGTLDVTTGKLTVDMAVNVLDGTQSISGNGAQAYGGLQVLYTPNPAKAFADSTATQNLNLFSDKFSSVALPDVQLQITGRATNSNVYFNMPVSVTTAVDARAWFSDNPTQIVYKLATPIEVDLDPVTIETLLGTNNIFADCGDTTVDYYADTTLFINKKIAATIAALS